MSYPQAVLRIATGLTGAGFQSTGRQVAGRSATILLFNAPREVAQKSGVPAIRNLSSYGPVELGHSMAAGPWGSAQMSWLRQIPVTDIARIPLTDIARLVGPTVGTAFGGFATGVAVGLLIDYLFDRLDEDGPLSTGMAPNKAIPAAGFVKCPAPTSNCGVSPEFYYGWFDHSCNTFVNCASAGTYLGAWPPPANGGWTRVMATGWSSQNNRIQVWDQWVVPSGPMPVANWQTGRNMIPAWDPNIEPSIPVPPNVDPLSQPIGQPAPDFRPIPYEDIPERVFNPDRSPLEQPYRGPEPAYDVTRDPGVEVIPGFRWMPDGEPGPTIIIEVRPNEKPDIEIQRPQRRNPRPPPPRTKERKTRLGLKGRASAWVSFITEARDAVSALWKALPKECRSRPAKGRKTVTAYQQAQDIYKCFGRLDLLQAMKNIAANEIQDRFYGKSSKQFQKAANRLAEAGYYKRPVGFQFGDRYRPRADVSDLGGAWDPFNAVGDFFNQNLPNVTPRDIWKALHGG